MLILSRVCADFHDARGNLLFSIRPPQRLTFVEAPDAIREDPLFQMLVNEGSLEASLEPVRRRTLEHNPMDGAEASGRRTAPSTPSANPSGAAPTTPTADPSASTPEAVAASTPESPSAPSTASASSTPSAPSAPSTASSASAPSAPSAPAKSTRTRTKSTVTDPESAPGDP